MSSLCIFQMESCFHENGIVGKKKLKAHPSSANSKSDSTNSCSSSTISHNKTHKMLERQNLYHLLDELL